MFASLSIDKSTALWREDQGIRLRREPGSHFRCQNKKTDLKGRFFVLCKGYEKDIFYVLQ